MELEQIKELMRSLQESKLSKLVFKKGDVEIHLEKEQGRPSSSKTISAEVASESAFQSELPLQGERGGTAREMSGTFVTSPMVGTFYAALAPDQPPLIKIGDQVEEQTVVCIIEAMKVMNEVKARGRGTIVEIFVENAQPVEFGTRLFRIQ